MKDIRINISIFDVIKILLVLSIAYALWFLRDLVLVVLASLVIASAIEPFAVGLTRHRIPRVISVLTVYIIFFASFFAVIVFVLPPILSETKDLLASVPGYIDNINSNTNVGQTFQGLSEQINVLLQGIRSGNFLGAISMVFGGIMSFVFIVIFSFYFAINEKGIEEFLRVLTPKNTEEYVIDLWKRAQEKMGLWLQGQLLLAVLIGVLVYLGLMVLGIPSALPLAVMAGLFELIPVFGPILSAVPAVALAFVTGGFTLAMLATGLYLIIQQFENNLIYPLVVTKVVGVPPVLSILALLVGAKLAGILGILLSIPIAAALQEIFEDWGKAKYSNLKTRTRKVKSRAK